VLWHAACHVTTNPHKKPRFIQIAAIPHKEKSIHTSKINPVIIIVEDEAIIDAVIIIPIIFIFISVFSISLRSVISSSAVSSQGVGIYIASVFNINKKIQANESDNNL
jgi:hypothetical protein